MDVTQTLLYQPANDQVNASLKFPADSTNNKTKLKSSADFKEVFKNIESQLATKLEESIDEANNRSPLKQVNNLLNVVDSQMNNISDFGANLFEAKTSAEALPKTTSESLLSLVVLLLNDSQMVDKQNSIYTSLKQIADSLSNAANSGSLGEKGKILLKLLAHVFSSDEAGAAAKVGEKFSIMINELPSSIKLKLKARLKTQGLDDLKEEEVVALNDALLKALSSLVQASELANNFGAAQGQNGLGLESDVGNKQTINQPQATNLNANLHINKASFEQARQSSDSKVLQSLFDSDASYIQELDEQAQQATNQTNLLSDAFEEVKNLASSQISLGSDLAANTSTLTLETASDLRLSESQKNNNQSMSTGSLKFEQPIEQEAKINIASDISSDGSNNNSSKSDDKAGSSIFVSQLGLRQSQSNTNTAELASKNGEKLFSDFIIEPKEVLSQVVGKLNILFSEGKSEAKIHLEPDFLGELKIHLIMDGNSVKAVLNTATAAAKDIIQANLDQLRQSLENQGIQVKDFQVNVGHQNASNNSSFGGHRSNNYSSQDNNNMRYASQLFEEEKIFNFRFGLTLNGNEAINCLA